MLKIVFARVPNCLIFFHCLILNFSFIWENVMVNTLGTYCSFPQFSFNAPAPTDIYQLHSGRSCCSLSLAEGEVKVRVRFVLGLGLG